MPPRGYNDAPDIARIDAHMAGTPGVSRRAAIIKFVGDANCRRVEIKMKARDDARLADARTEVVLDHVARYPVVLTRDGADVSLLVVSAGTGPDGFLCTGLASRTATGEPRKLTGFHVSADAPVDGRWTFERMAWAASSDGLFDAMAALGLSMTEIRGALVRPSGPAPVVASLAERLADAWKTAGLEGAGDVESAAASEGERLDQEGLSPVSALVPHDLRRLAAAYGGVGMSCAGIASPGIEPARTALLVRLASFAHPALAALSDDEVLRWSGRPAECLVSHLNEGILPAIDVGRPVTLCDAGWLLDVFGGRATAPLKSRMIEALLRWQSFVDPTRIVSDDDASGLVSMMAAVVDGDHGTSRSERVDDGLRLLFSRLGEGRDAGRAYGDVAAGLRGQADSERGREGDAFARRVFAATAGVERLCEKVAYELAIPTLAWDCAVGRGLDTPGLGGLLSASLESESLWPPRIEQHVRDMTVGGRRMDEMAAVVLASGIDFTDSAPTPFRLDSSRAMEVVARWASPRSSDARLDAAWSAFDPVLVPRWRGHGRRMLEGQFAPLVKAVASRSKVEAVSVGRELRRIARRLFAPTQRD
jgi:hypothetical protein